MARAKTGDGEPYDNADEDAAQAVADEAWAEWEESQGREAESGDDGGTDDLPTAMHVTADVEWAGENRGLRSTTLEGLHLGEFHRATERSRKARAAAGRARPLGSYRAQSWSAQLRQLEATQHGRRALAQAGFDAAARTRRRWRAGTGSPNKARREQIADAYEQTKTRPVLDALEKLKETKKDLTTTLTETLRDRYGVNIRLHDIRDMELRRR